MPLLGKLKVFFLLGPHNFIFLQSSLLPNPPLRLGEIKKKKKNLLQKEKRQLLKNGKQGHHSNILMWTIPDSNKTCQE